MATTEHRPKVLRQLPSPSFIINRRVFINNCRKIYNAVTAQEGDDLVPSPPQSGTTTSSPSPIKLRPHVKTHKCQEGAFIQAFLKEGVASGTHPVAPPADGVVGFVASTIPEMEMLYQCAKRFKTLKPFGDILYGIPISSSKIQRILEIKRKFDELATDNNGDKVALHVLVDNIGQVQMLKKFSSVQKLSVYLKVDTGYHRAGVSITEDGVNLACTIIRSNFLSLKGLYSHW